MAGRSILTSVEEDLRGEFTSAHVKAHVIQFAGLFVGGFLAALVGAQFRVSGWDALAGFAAGAAGAAARQMWPQIPWPLVLKVLGDARETTATAALPPPAMKNTGG